MQERHNSTDGRHRLSAVADRLSAGIANRFAIDTRALAVFRIALGLLLLTDLALRSRDLEAFYTDAGVLPRAALFSDYSNVYSLHAISGELWAIALLFVVAAVFAAAVTIGYRTRLATVCSWLLLLSLHARNPMVLNGGDTFLRILLFWAMFLPLGERWAVDARRTDEPRATVSNVATMALLLQVTAMYVVNAIHKSRGEMWFNGEAVVYVFSLDYKFTFLLGDVLAKYPELLRMMTYLWTGLLLSSPLLLLLTGRPRAVLATAFAGMHLGMLVTMRIGIFPLVVVTALVPFYPPVVWDGLGVLATRAGLARPLRAAMSRLRVSLPEGPTISGLPTAVPAPQRLLTAGAAHGRTLFSTVIPWLFLVLVILSNAQAVGYTQVPEPGEDALEATETDQNWQMFAPEPLGTDGWFIAPAELENGSEIDALHRSDVSWDPPSSHEDVYPTSRWRKYLANVWGGDNKNHESYLANHLCERWNGTHETDIEQVDLYYMAQPSEPYNETEPVDSTKLQEYRCDGEFIQD
ncbi:HTTM domain-containing protein [Natrinema hispanicum]|uniref:Vitamin K-dependent gamma-carboxylase n=1 Tax=Natrinema hispanicum TaxID=392421 RepID=A0A1I0G919_9EURY|nr:HTTM domain-containing protein [Natrinema hispanicum]SDC56082.1 Vitamin K-dependent gamma-carboxylase [Natrinema hispanicum]SET67249.1 Vitamin K-dependent gamma-carboxylase [Natrinema hispanicum]